MAGLRNASLNQHGTRQSTQPEMISESRDAARLGVAGAVRRQPAGTAVASLPRPAAARQRI